MAQKYWKTWTILSQNIMFIYFKEIRIALETLYKQKCHPFKKKKKKKVVNVQKNSTDKKHWDPIFLPLLTS